MPRAISPIIDLGPQVLPFKHMEPLPVTSGHLGIELAQNTMERMKALAQTIYPQSFNIVRLFLLT